MKTKHCFKCKQIKAVDMFYTDKNTHNGIACYCKDCSRKINMDRYKPIIHISEHIPSMPNEIWMDIIGHEGYYRVSNMGRVISTGKRENSTKNKFSDIERLLTISKTPLGYKYFKAWVNMKSKHILLHRAIAQAFIPNPENKPYINHKNGIKHDNRIENLEWVTPQENARHAWDLGLYKSPQTFWKGKFGKDHIQSKLIHQFNMDGELIKTFENARIAADELCLNDSAIRRCARGISKHSGGFIFKYSK